ncbi:unnamed protein product [Brassica oleracea]
MLPRYGTRLSEHFQIMKEEGYPDLSLSPTIPPRPTRTGEESHGGQTETMLNPLWSGFELVMAGTSAEVHLPPDHEARLYTANLYVQNKT